MVPDVENYCDETLGACVFTDCPPHEQDNDMNQGVWFKSSITGMLYRNHRAAGDIDCILVDGQWFDPAR